MTAILFEYPQKAAFGKVLTKGKIYEYAKPRTSVKELFIRQVEQIVWQFKLAPETINIKSTPNVPEIQVFGITLKGNELKTDVLRCIDQAIPFPIIFEVSFKGRIKPVACHKRISGADFSKWVVSQYFEGGWVAKDMQRKPLPVVFDLEALYGHLLMPLMQNKALPGERLQDCVQRMEKISLCQREIEKCESRLKKEKQFNRKVEINAELRALLLELKNLKGEA